jgi:tRNA-splicing ligase RtcB
VDKLRTKDLTKIGYTDNVARSIAVAAVNRHCKHRGAEEVLAELADVIRDPAGYARHEVWGQLSEHFCPARTEEAAASSYQLRDKPIRFKNYGGESIEPAAIRQMELAMRLPITVAGALMPDAHAGYGLPIGAALAVENAVIPYAVGVDITVIKKE